MKPLFNRKRVDETTAFIAAELRILLDRSNIDSHMSRRVREACPVYGQGQTIGESVLATLRALNIVQLEVFADLASLEREESWFEEEEEDYEPLSHPTIMTEQRLKDNPDPT